MKRLRLTSAETRDWLRNRSYLIEDGKAIREAKDSDPPENILPYRLFAGKQYLESHGPVIQLVRCDGTFLKVLRSHSQESSAPLAKSPTVAVPRPDECHCADYAGRENGQHHAVCEYRCAWDRIASGKSLLTIIDIATGKALRTASIEEAESFERDKNPIINIGGTDYGIVESSPL